MKNEIIITNEYGKVALIEPNGNKISTESVEEMMQVMDKKCGEYDNPTVKVETYAGTQDGIIDASDLTILAAMCCWGKNMYFGDCIKITMTAEYMPENK